MYKLLLISDVGPVRDAFAGLKWELMGFRQPQVVASAEEAAESLKRFHTDAVAIGLENEAENDKIFCQLMQTHPDTPVMEVGDDVAALEKKVVELRKVLNRINADVSNTSFTPGEQLMVCRHEFFRAMMDRRIPTAQDIRRSLRLLRSKMEAEKPCVVAELGMPDDSDFLRGRWHYGTERLELALRNIFGVEVDGLRILSCVLPGDRIILLCCPMLYQNVNLQGDELVALLTEHVNGCIAHVDEFLGLDLSITSIEVLPALTALAKDA